MKQAISNFRKENLFIVIFILFVLAQNVMNTIEMYPFSAFGMYKGVTSKLNVREYSLTSSGHDEKNNLLAFGDYRFYLKYRLDRIVFLGAESFEGGVKDELKIFFRNEIKPNDKRIFVIKLWEIFQSQNYESPDQVIRIPFGELN